MRTAWEGPPSGVPRSVGDNAGEAVGAEVAANVRAGVEVAAALGAGERIGAGRGVGVGDRSSATGLRFGAAGDGVWLIPALTQPASTKAVIRRGRKRPPMIRMPVAIGASITRRDCGVTAVVTLPIEMQAAGRTLLAEASNRKVEGRGITGTPHPQIQHHPGGGLPSLVVSSGTSWTDPSGRSQPVKSIRIRQPSGSTGSAVSTGT